ncbi:hypothetical protein OIU84_007580 [Salix udensis]|uniref:Uncharacterized protein n=1 Tax=Salix udensis TaxID=889485 RepID=A0AAD6NZK0_9ROSI|nr:hypothetical protein OIU84_007580 [Salix udensis]
MRETSWVSGIEARAEMGYRREMRWVPREARDDTDGHRRRGTEEARDDVRSQARGEVRRQRVKERRRSGGGDNDGEGEVKGKGKWFPLLM